MEKLKNSDLMMCTGGCVGAWISLVTNTVLHFAACLIKRFAR